MKKTFLVSFFLALSLPLTSRAQTLLQVPDNREGWPWGLCVHQTVSEQGPATQALGELGAPWVRIDANWYGIETQQGQYDWTTMDKMVDTARSNGLLVYATLAYTPAWASQSTEVNGVPTAPEHYGNFVSAAVARYKDRVKHWGLWNEPEGSRFWNGTPQQLVDYILRPGAEAIHAQDPDALVLGPDSGSDEWLDSIFKAGGGQYLDIITVHVYACCDDSDNVAKVLQRLDCTGAWPWETCRHKAITSNGLGNKPVWLTETGWKTLSADWEQKQADYYVKLLDAMRARSAWWKKTIFYELSDAEPCDPAKDNCWGILRVDTSHKPAFDALKNYIAAHQPRAGAGADIVGTAGQAVSLSGSASQDPDGQIVRYRWDFNRADGVTAEAEGETVLHVFDSPGSYTVTLVVTDNDGIEDGDTVVVTVKPGSDAGVPETGGDAPVEAEADQSIPVQDTGPLKDTTAESLVSNDGATPSEAGTDVAASKDAGAESSASGPAVQPNSESGCGCRTAGESAGDFLPPTLLGLLAVLARKRRRTAGRTRPSLT